MANREPEVTPKKKRSLRDWTVPFLKHLAVNGIVSHACLKAGISRKTAYQRRRDDEAFAESWDEAIETAIEAMEVECYRRAVRGVEKPVYQGGKQVGTVREYSDTLLMFYLKAVRPEKYREPRPNVTIVNDAATVTEVAAKAALMAAKEASEGSSLPALAVLAGPDVA